MADMAELYINATPKRLTVLNHFWLAKLKKDS